MSILAAYMVPHPPMIIPEVGCGRESIIDETTKAYIEVAKDIAGIKPDTIIVTDPHLIMYGDYNHISPGQSAEGDMSSFGAPKVHFREEYDEQLVSKIETLCLERNISAGTLGGRKCGLDHGIMVPLYFIRQYYQGGKIVHVGLSGLHYADHYHLGMAISDAVTLLGRRAVVVASGDLSHRLKEEGPYGFDEEGPKYDARIMDVLTRGDLGEVLEFDESQCDRAGECGHKSFVIMAGTLDGLRVETKVLSHQDVTGVGYGVCILHPQGVDENRHFLGKYLDKEKNRLDKYYEGKDAYVILARQAIYEYVEKGITIKPPSELPSDMLNRKAGAFVSIHKLGRLRGCIGTIGPTKDSLAEEIIANAISASVNDSRFLPLSKEETDYLEISVDVLEEPEDIDDIHMLDVKKYGVIVTSGNKRGLLLPDLEGINTVEYQVRIAMDKAGIEKGEPVSLQRFKVVRH